MVKNADGLLMRSVIFAAGYIVLLLTIASIPPPSPIADRLSQPQRIRISEGLQKRF